MRYLEKNRERIGDLQPVAFIFGIMLLLTGTSLPVQADQQGVNRAFRIVQSHLSRSLGLAREEIRIETDLVADLRQDRTRILEAVLKMYQALGIRNSKTDAVLVSELVRIVNQNYRPKRGRSRSFRTTGPHKEGSRNVPSVPSFYKKRQPSASTRSLGGGDSDRASVHDPEANVNAYQQTVFYATNRNTTGNSDITDFYGLERSRKLALSYGVARVNIPRSHKPGQLETPWLGGLWTGYKEADHIFVKQLNPLNRDAFKDMTRVKNHWRGSEKDILIYVHGFNVTFDEGIRRAAQIAFDFGFRGTSVSFSWPSDGSSKAYNADREDASWTVKYFEDFLKMMTRNPERKVHIIAHSMGNQVVLNALRGLAYQGYGIERKMLGSVILAAPDFDAGLFSEQIASEIHYLADQWTIYASRNDYALWISEKLNATKRLGTPLTLAQGYQVIDASELEVTPWNLPENHSYYATKKVILEDMIAVINGLGPDKRGLKKIVSGTFLFWRFPR